MQQQQEEEKEEEEEEEEEEEKEKEEKEKEQQKGVLSFLFNYSNCFELLKALLEYDDAAAADDDDDDFHDVIINQSLQIDEWNVSNEGTYDHIETHISHLFFMNGLVVKLKKAVFFDFGVDFLSRISRRKYCVEEVRLNRKLSRAKCLYIGVIGIVYCPETRDYSFTRNISDSAVIIEDYLVVMHRYPQSSLLSRMLKENQLTMSVCVRAATEVARIHDIACRRPDMFSFEIISNFVNENITNCLMYKPWPMNQSTMLQLSEHYKRVLKQLETKIQQRQLYAVKETHGDLHLNNICMFDDQIFLTDCIEFSEELRCCDVWADVAFMALCLWKEGQPNLTSVVISRYAECSDDFDGILLLDLFLSYRAAVRAKVACFRIGTPLTEIAEISTLDSRCLEAGNEAISYIDIALQAISGHRRVLYSKGVSPCSIGPSRQPSFNGLIVAIGGLSGSGKSTVSYALLMRFIASSAIAVRSDAVRKHLWARLNPEWTKNIDCTARLLKRLPVEGYTTSISDMVYETMMKYAAKIICSGRVAILDAAFASPERRASVMKYAESQNSHFFGFWLHVEPEIARSRIDARHGDVSDADNSVFNRQLKELSAPIPSAGKQMDRWIVLDSSSEPSSIVDALLSFIDDSALQAAGIEW